MSATFSLALLLVALVPTSSVARFALIIGHNGSADPANAKLRYADDDALRAAELLSSFVPRGGIELLVEADADSRSLFGELASMAAPPTAGRLDAAVERISARVQTRRAAGVRTEVYVMYGGHGDVDAGAGFIELLDGRFSAKDLETRVLDRLGADLIHLLVDSCNSYFLLSPRRPGGRRYQVTFEKVMGFFERHPNVGVLLSTSAANEVFEWSELQSGIFSHELRSGLLGAADADADGQVTYREMAAFVHVANQDLENERYRPHIFVRPPQVEANAAIAPVVGPRRVRFHSNTAGRFYLEDDRGLRVADVHKAGGESLVLVLPGASGRRYFMKQVLFGQGGRATEVREKELPSHVAEVAFTRAETRASESARGGEATIFRRLFQSPFDRAAMERWGLSPREAEVPQVPSTWSLVAALGLQSGYTSGVTVMPAVELGARFGVDRLSLGLRGTVALGTSLAPRHDLRAYGLIVTPRYDLPLWWLALSAGPTLGAELEEQVLERESVGAGGVTTTTREVLRAPAFRWGALIAGTVPVSDLIEVGLELELGGRIFSIDGQIQHRPALRGALAFALVF